MPKDEWEAKGKPGDRLVRNFTLKHNALSREFLESYAANYTNMLRMVQSIYPRVGGRRGAGRAAAAAGRWGPGVLRPCW
jgi:hypothetical protein